MKLMRLGWDYIQPDSSQFIYFTSKIWSWNQLWAKDIPEKAIWVLFTWTVLQTQKSLCNSDGPCTQRGGNVFYIKNKSRRLPRILKGSDTTWQPDLELMISREIFSELEFLIISKVQKLTQSSWEQSEAGRCRVLALATTPSQLKSEQQLLCKTPLQKSSSIKKEIHKKGP